MQYYIKRQLKLVLMSIFYAAPGFGLTVKKPGVILKIWELSHNYIKKWEE